MAREMTPQERAAAFIKSTFPLHLREDGEPCDGDIEDVIAHDKQTRRAALLECANKVKDRAALWRSHGGAKIGFPYGHLTVEDECDSIADELHRLAQEG